jgi:LppP/LprE lipoprotein
MRRGLLSTFVLLLGVPCVTLLTGCGGSTKTVSVASAPPVQSTTTTTTPPTRTSSTTATTAPTTTTAPSESGGTSSPSTTRTAPTPAFVHTEGGSASASSAAAVVREHGFTPNDTSEYHPNQTLRVLIGTRTGSAEQSEEQAFFFVDERYIGTDSKQPSAQIHVVNQSDTEVTLAYSLSSPSGAPAGQADVRFQLDNGQLTPLDPIPSPASRR